jgi:hypothetical protein
LSETTVWQEVESLFSELDIARIEENSVVFLDGETPFIELMPPPSMQESAIVWGGLEYLRTKKPPTALLLSLHGDGADFDRLVRHADHLLKASPVCGVEAFTEAERTEQGMPHPQLARRNHWLKAFQETQFPWMDVHDIAMLPLEPQWEGALGGRLNRLYDLFFSLPGKGLEQYSPEARHAIQHPLLVYLSVYRSWGILGQFGHWLQQPEVQDKLAGYTGHIPLILGSGHTAERYLLQEYCKLDTISIVSDRPMTDGNSEAERAKVGSYYRLQAAGILRQVMHTSDLAVLFPNE